MEFVYVPKGVCSRRIKIRIENGLVEDVAFERGCEGNLQGIARLVAGMEPAEVIRRLEGVNCMSRGTSCPDQLAKAMRALLDEQGPLLEQGAPHRREETEPQA